MNPTIKKLLEELRAGRDADPNGDLVIISRRARDLAVSVIQSTHDPENQPSQYGTTLVKGA